MIHDPGEMEWGGMKFQHGIQEGMQMSFFFSGIFLLIFSDHSWLQVTETTESETVDKGALLYMLWLQ